jgi:hypothetical protein
MAEKVDKKDITEAHYFGDCCDDATTLQLY